MNKGWREFFEKRDNSNFINPFWGGILDSKKYEIDLTNYLVKKGVVIKEATEIVGRLVKYAINKKVGLEKLSLTEFKEFHNLFENDIYETIKSVNNIKSKNKGAFSEKEFSLEELALSLNKLKFTNFLNKDRTIDDKNWKEKYSKDSKGYILIQSYLDLLRKKNLYNDFVDYIDKFNWEISFILARHFFYTSYIYKFVKDKKNKIFFKKKKIRLLEIGGGAGTLAINLREKFKIVDYVNVDFVEMSICNFYQQKKYFSKFNIPVESNFFNSDEKIKKLNPSRLSNSSFRMNFLEPKCFFNNLSKLGKFDLIVNTLSFQEMDMNLRNQYLNSCSFF